MTPTGPGRLAIWALVAAGAAFNVAAPVWASPSTVGDVLDLAPADTEVLVVVPSLAEFNHLFATLNLQLGLGRPELDGVLTAFKRSVGLNAGVRDDGPMLIAASLTGAGDDTGFQVLVALPTTDYQRVIEILGGDADSEVARLTFATGHTVYAKKSGDFAVMSSGRDLLKAYQPGQGAAAIGQQLGEGGQWCLDRSQASVIIHGKNKARAIEALRQSLASQDRQTGQDLGPQPDSAEAPTEGQISQQKIVQQLAKRLTQPGPPDGSEDVMLRDADAIIIGLDLNEDGFGVTGAVQFKAGTPLASAFTTGLSATGQLDRLPSLPYAGAFAINLDGMDVKKIAGVSQTAKGSWLQGVAGHVHQIKSMTQVTYLPSDGGLGSASSKVKLIETDDAKGFVHAMRQNIEALGVPSGGTPAAFRTTYTSNALQLDDVNGDQYAITRHAAPPKQTSGQTGSLPMGLGGSDRHVTGYIVEAGDYVVVTETTDSALLRQVLESIKVDTGLGTAHLLAQCRRNLPENPTMEGFLDLGAIVNSPMMMAMAMFLGQLPPPPERIPPMGLAVMSKNSGAMGRLFIPMPVMQFAVDTVQEVMARQHGATDEFGPDRRRRPLRPRPLRRRFNDPPEPF